MSGASIPRRKPIILIGAPSGAGKTELSKKIMAHELPYFVGLCTGESVPIVRHDLKVLPDELPRDQIHIIECATHQYDVLRKRDWPRLIHLLQDCELVIHVTMEVAKPIVIRQYFFRIFTQPQRLNLFLRLLKITKYKRLIGYLLTPQLARATSHWATMGHVLAKTSNSPVVLVRARRKGDDYEFMLEGGNNRARDLV